MNKEYLVISYYPAPYEGSPHEINYFYDSLEEARADKLRKEKCHENERKELRPDFTIYEVIEVK